MVLLEFPLCSLNVYMEQLGGSNTYVWSNPSVPWMKVMAPFSKGFSNCSLEWYTDEEAYRQISLLPYQNFMTQIKQIVPHHIPLHTVTKVISSLRFSPSFLFNFLFFAIIVLDSWSASKPCARLIRCLSSRINIWRICLFPPAASLSSISSVNKGIWKKLHSAMWLKSPPKEELAYKSMLLFLKNLI